MFSELFSQVNAPFSRRALEYGHVPRSEREKRETRPNGFAVGRFADGDLTETFQALCKGGREPSRHVLNNDEAGGNINRNFRRNLLERFRPAGGSSDFARSCACTDSDD